ncbi:hypothetical protein AB0B15_38510 [Streptomyces sp. NPDC045456]|uniref:hypothetical protein n=1 Tax=Streptomyces sp. NPDC045456 TaxID=3155254 RepID=UPI003408C392
MPKRDAAQKRAREIQDTEGTRYHDALNRARAELAETATEETPAPTPAAVAYVLEPTVAEAELGITAEELGVRALPETATPEQRAHAEAVWRPTEAEQPCRCTGAKCHHGAPCGIEYADEGPCPGPMQHVDRHPGSMFSLTAWYDVYRCTDCGETYETTVELPELPWGEVRNRDELNGTERTLSDGLGGTAVTVIYHGIRHPNFPDHTPEEDDEDELDPDAYPTPEDDYDRYDDEDEEHEEPLAEDDQEPEDDYLDDDPQGDVDPPEDYDDRPGEDELGPPSEVPAVEPRPTAADWSPLDNAPPSAW